MQHNLLQPLLLAASLAPLASAGRSLRHVGKLDIHRGDYSARLTQENANKLNQRSADADFLFLNNKTSSYAVNGTDIPEVSFDVGESYSGSLPISSDPSNSTGELFWWFFPSTNPDAAEEIVIWLNGGPGCSSLEGLLQESGPFTWQYGIYQPVENTWSWNKLTNIVYIEQPVGTGFSVGTPTATSEEDVAQQFLGFWKNFVDLFSLQGYKVYITGESYAGMYCPYIGAAMLDANDTTYYNVSGMLIYDPVIGNLDVQSTVVSVPFVDYLAPLFPFNDSFVADIHNRSDACGYTDYINEYLVYPPPGQQPTNPPSSDSNGVTIPECENIYNDIYDAAVMVNPCWDVYHVSTTCPTLWDVLSFTAGAGNSDLPPYFDRDDVKAAIHAPNITWSECSNINVFVDGMDWSDPSSVSVLPQVIDATQNVIIAHGALDFVLINNGTLLSIQNMTWGGQRGFQTRPTEPMFVPLHNDPIVAASAGSGIMGTTHTERGLTYVGVDLSGHMIPQYAPTVAYRQLEFLLGRVSGLSSTEPFTTDKNVTQPTTPLGNGNGPQGWSTGSD